MELFELSTWSGLIFEALSIIILGLSALAVKALSNWLKMKGISEQIIAKEELAAVIVGFVEQTYYQLEGPEKFDIAVASLAARLKQYGLTIDADEIHELIEDAVLQMQDIWIETIYDDDDDEDF